MREVARPRVDYQTGIVIDDPEVARGVLPAELGDDLRVCEELGGDCRAEGQAQHR